MQGLQESKRFKTGALGALVVIIIGVLQVLIPDLGDALAQRQEEILLLVMLLMSLFGLEDLILAFKGEPVIGPPTEPTPTDSPQ